ncbi:Osmolarity sensor protein EnvZ [compost metagenome]
MKWLWPQSLTGRLVIILVIGMLAAQILTGTIWYDMRYGKALEMPTRLAASELATHVRIIEALPLTERAGVIEKLNREEFRLSVIAPPPLDNARVDSRRNAIELLFKNVLKQELGKELHAHVLKVDLQKEDVQKESETESEALTLFSEQYPSGHFLVQLELSDGTWLQADMYEGQAGMDMSPLTALYDYLMRIYVLRIVAIVLIALFVVRLVMQPLKKLARAAEQLGENIHSAPLAVVGPREVRQAAQAFNAMQARLIDNMAERTRFLAAVSHDLRSPITRLKLRTELLSEPELQQKFRKDLDEMEAMVTATLHFVRHIDIDENRHNVDINTLLASLQIDAEEVGAKVTISGKAEPISAYARSLRRCLQNLLENAIRYGSEAHIEVIDTAHSLRILIRDRGPGIPADLLESVLQPFVRVETSRNSSSGGFGLGLSIAHTVALAHNGTLTLRNHAAGGLEAELDLPRKNTGAA